MKRILLLLVFVISTTQAQNKNQSDNQNIENNKYKEHYQHQIDVIKNTDNVIYNVVKELKENNFKKKERVKALVVEAFDTLDQGGESREKYLQYAREKKWKLAFQNAERFWQFQVKSADLFFRAKRILNAN